MNEISLILPNFPKDKKEKNSIIPSLLTGFIGLAYEGISNYLHNKREKALYKAFMVMENKINLQCNKTIHLENSMVMYDIYNLDILEKLIDMIDKKHTSTTWNEKLFTGKFDSWYNWYLSKNGIGHYSFNSLLYLRTLREKYIKMYDEFIHQSCMYAKAI